ncbi:MAG: hypothetical protein EA425_03470 [Puniceicoccaceae bacterium]|nr:MAG: hypothetical protein EA425_03470 [Puniceicoccaceae bacterium]
MDVPQFLLGIAVIFTGSLAMIGLAWREYAHARTPTRLRIETFTGIQLLLLGVLATVYGKPSFNVLVLCLIAITVGTAKTILSIRNHYGTSMANLGSGAG